MAGQANVVDLLVKQIKKVQYTLDIHSYLLRIGVRGPPQIHSPEASLAFRGSIHTDPH